MFKTKDSSDEEMGFADTYKSEILNPKDETEDTSLEKLIIILILITIILGLSIFAYIYISNNNNKDKSESDTNIEERREKRVEPPKEAQTLNNIDELMIEDLGNGEFDEVDDSDNGIDTNNEE